MRLKGVITILARASLINGKIYTVRGGMGKRLEHFDFISGVFMLQIIAMHSLQFAAI